MTWRHPGQNTIVQGAHNKDCWQAQESKQPPVQAGWLVHHGVPVQTLFGHLLWLSATQLQSIAAQCGQGPAT